MKIAPYNESHRDAVRQICLETGPAAALTDERTAAYILADYCNYYLDCEPEHCFVLEDDDGKARGYIICAADNKAYRERFAPYAQIIKKNAGKAYIETVAEQFALRLFSQKYPAHLHIDISDDYTGQGMGSELIETLLARLKEEGVRGVMLIAGSGNTGALRFYRRHGFKKIISLFGATIMGKSLGT